MKIDDSYRDYDAIHDVLIEVYPDKKNGPMKK